MTIVHKEFNYYFDSHDVTKWFFINNFGISDLKKQDQEKPTKQMGLHFFC